MAASPTSASFDPALRAFYRAESERLGQEFAVNSSGTVIARGRALLVDKLLLHMWDQQPGLRDSGYALVALGGFGRTTLFPYSDVDLLFLCENENLRKRAKDPVRAICQELWDTGLRVSPTTRTVEDCARFDQDNVEFTISLFDSRLLIGDDKLFARVHERNLPQLVAREATTLARGLTEVTRNRHLRYGNTIFHLEPNLKDGPGGLRDFNVTHWLATIA